MGSVKYNELSNRWIVGIVTLWNGDVNIIFRECFCGGYMAGTSPASNLKYPQYYMTKDTKLVRIYTKNKPLNTYQ